MSGNAMRLMKTGALVGGSAYLASKFVYKVNEGEHAIILSRFNGIQMQPVGPGIHFKIPLVHFPYLLNTAQRTYEFETVEGGLDGSFKVKYHIIFHPSADHFADIFTDLGQDYDVRVLPTLCCKIIKPLLAECDTADLSTSINKISKQIKEELESQAKEFHILIDDVYIEDVQSTFK